MENMNPKSVVEQYILDEQNIIGIALKDPEKLFDIPELKPDHFYYRAHRELYTKILDLFKENSTSVTLSNIAPYAVEAGVSISDLSDWAGSVFPSDAVRTASRIIKYSKARKAAELGEKLLTVRNTANPEAIDEAIRTAYTDIAAVSESDMKADEGDDMMTVLGEVNEHIEHMQENGGGMLGLGTGLKNLDMMTSGLQGGQLIVVAARPAMGKTAFSLSLTKAIGLDQNTPVVFYSLETKKRPLGLRMVSNAGNIDGMLLKLGRLRSEEEWKKYTWAMSELSRAKIKIKDNPNITPSGIRAECRKLKREWGLGAIVVDYLQLITPDRPSQNRVQEITQITRELKILALELDVPIVVLSQLSRQVEQRENKRPMLSDLRESGSIEQDADVVMFLYRDDYYNQKSDRKNILEIIIGKQRDGAVGTVEALYLRNYNKVLDLETRQVESIA